MVTSSRSGSKAARVVPTAASTRPQLGSAPKIAHLKRLLRATARATSRASSTLAAPTTSMAMSWWAPSASPMSWRARSAQTAATAASSSACVGVTPLAPEARSRTVSLVDMHPSESIRSKLTAVPSRRALSSAAGVATASVVRTTSIVARAGASIPAPLAIPETDQPSPVAVACLGTVSVVMIAVAAAGWPSPVRRSTASSTPTRRVSMGSSSPMRPVEQTATSPAERPRAAATCSAVRCVSRKPWEPVQALAPPELRTTASTRPSLST